MLNVSFFTFNAFEENTYIISNEAKECWIVDPGMYYPEEEQQMLKYLHEKQLTPKGIINTHAHLDHIFGIQMLKETFNISLGMHELELPVLKRAGDMAAMFGFRLQQVPVHDYFINEHAPLKLGNDELMVLLTPGHSPGSISFYYPKGGWVIAGDVLFAGSIGRTDLPGSDFDTLMHSIKTQLYTLPADTTVLPGHGPSTTIGDEQQHNPFVK